MSDDRKLEVIDPNGWRKEYPLEKTVIFIGSDPTSDIHLKVDPGGGIAARHLQLIAVPDVGYRLVNLGESRVLVGAAGDREVTPRASAELADGEQIKIGEFILILRGEVWSSGGAAGPTNRSKNIGLSLTLPKTELAPHETMEGIVTVFNLGDFSGAQFDLDLAGLEPDCFELEPGPLLSSGADKEVMFRLYHLGHKPLAGDVNLTVRAMASKAYPAEQISVSRRIRVLPYYSYQLAIVTPGAVKPAAAPDQKKAPVAPVGPPAKPAPARPSQPTPAPSGETADWWSGELPVKAAVAATTIAGAEVASSALTETTITSAIPAAEPTATPEPEPAPRVEQAEVEPPGYFVEPAPAETGRGQADPITIEAEPVEAAPVEAEAVSPPQPAAQLEPEPPAAEPIPPPSPRELAMASASPPAEDDDWWSPTRQPEPTPTDQTLWSAGAAAATTASEQPRPAQVEPESISPPPPPGEDNLPPTLQGKKVLKIAASQPPPVESETPAVAGTDLWSAGEVEPADESTEETETDSQG